MRLKPTTKSDGCSRRHWKSCYLRSIRHGWFGDLSRLGFKTRKAPEGRPSYGASLLLKVWLYGYVSGTRSCRGLERACLDQMGMLWLSGMNSPDHTTLWRFWRDNQKPIRKTFKQLLKVALSLDLIGLVLHAVDGTKILSAASESNGLHRT